MSTRRNESPLLRRKRDAAVANQQCVHVQWRFLQHQNPVPPTFTPESSRAPLLPSSAAPAPPRRTRGSKTPAHDTRSPSKLFQLFANPQVEAEIRDEYKTLHEQELEQQRKRSHQQCRVLNDILGETQRKAMLSRIMGDMEALALQAHASSSLAQPHSEHGAHDGHHRQERVSGASLGDKSATCAPLRDDSKLEPLVQRKLSGVQALRTNLSLAPPTASHSPASHNAIHLLPQRRMTALGTLALEETAAEDGRHESEEDDDDDGDGDGDDDDGRSGSDDNTDSGNDQDGSDRASRSSRSKKRTAESIAMAEIRKLRRRHMRRQQRLRERGEGVSTSGDATANDHIFWQKSARVRLALDIPQALQVPVHLVDASARARPTALRTASIASASASASTNASRHDIVASAALPAPLATPLDEQQSFDSLVSRRRRPFLARTDSTQSLVTADRAASPSKADQVRPGESSSAALSSPPLSPVVSPRDARKLRAPYGAWYLPRQQWWELHQKERQALAERFPDEARALAVAHEALHDHCHHTPHARDHKPAVVSQVTAATGATVPGGGRSLSSGLGAGAAIAAVVAASRIGAASGS